jgi:hypothetical protein
MTINGIDACAEHVHATLDLIVDTLATEHGMPLDVARRALAKLLRQALDE